MDSDVYKWIEAASLELARQPSADLEALIERAIDAIEPAQKADGYLNSYYTVAEPGAALDRLRARPRAVLRRPPLPGGRGAPPRDRQRAPAERRPAVRGPHRRHVRPRQAEGHARPPGDRDGAGGAVPRDRRAPLPRPGRLPAGQSRPRLARPEPPLRRLVVLPGPGAGPRVVGGRGPRRAGALPDGRRRGRLPGDRRAGAAGRPPAPVARTWSAASCTSPAGSARGTWPRRSASRTSCRTSWRTARPAPPSPASCGAGGCC